MLATAELVSKRYKIGREAQDRYGVLSQQRAAGRVVADGAQQMHGQAQSPSRQPSRPTSPSSPGTSSGSRPRRLPLRPLRLLPPLRLLLRLLPLFRAAFLETNPAPIKMLLHLDGRMTPETRLPLVPASDAATWPCRMAIHLRGSVSCQA